MKRVVQLVVAVMMTMTIATIAVAESDPAITGIAAGTEFCFQIIPLCGAAIFGGSVQLQVDGKPRKGTFVVSVNHQAPLPDTQGESVLITGGTWVITTKKEDFSGVIPQNSGTITRLAGDNFALTAQLDLIDGGTGTIYFSGTLSHEHFPFTVVGTISQDAPTP